MNIDNILDSANDLINHAGPAVKSTAKDALHTVETTADHAKDAVVHQAADARKAMRSRVLKTYDLAVNLAPFLLPERAAKVRSRRIAYVAVGSVVLGAAGIAVLELAKPGTLASFGRRVKGLFASGAAEVKTEALHALDTVKDTAMHAKDQAEHLMDDAKRTAEHVIDGVKGVPQQATQAAGMSGNGKDGKGTNNASMSGSTTESGKGYGGNNKDAAKTS
ncbi:MAG: hypothetical protein HOO96_12245 [Polyangiaceae bacterium]|nr:hypothetical protein [Polyangiaceae bacterium]